MPASQQIAGMLWGLGVGIALIISIWAVIRGGWFRKPTNDVLPEGDITPEPTAPVHDYPEGLAEAHGKIPLFNWIVIVGFVLWAIGYVVVFARAGFTFS